MFIFALKLKPSHAIHLAGKRKRVKVLEAELDKGRQGPYSRHFIFFITYKWAEQAKVFMSGKTFQTSVMNTLAYWAIC